VFGFYATPVSMLIGIAFQTTPALFRPLFRTGFGKRYFLFWRNVVFPFALLTVGFYLRALLPQWVSHTPIAYVPLLSSQLDPGLLVRAYRPLAHGEAVFFVHFALLFLLAALFQYGRLVVNRARGIDTLNTRSWGRSWLGFLPGFSHLSQATIQGKVEPAIVALAGFVSFQFAPLFGFYLIVGGLLLAIENVYLWRQIRSQSLDARDALAQAERHKADHEAARAQLERILAHSSGQIGAETLAEIQQRPHALLDLTPEEGLGALGKLGVERFAQLCDGLPQAEQEALFARLSRA